MYTNNYNQDETDKFPETQITKLVKEGETAKDQQEIESVIKTSQQRKEDQVASLMNSTKH